jgi:hypothetical protein
MDRPLPPSAHWSQPWRIHAIASDLRLLDVWALPTPGGADDFTRLVELVVGFDPARRSSLATRALFTVRNLIGAVLRLDRPGAGLGARVAPLRDRLPADLRDSAAGPESVGAFTPLYRTADEWALELANQTVHGVLHLGWVQDGAGAYRGQMAVLVKPNGRLGDLYLAAIAPFRHLVVYPQMLRELERAWRRPAPAAVAA